MMKVPQANPMTVLVEGLIFAAGRSGLERKFILEKVPTMSKKELEECIDFLKYKYPEDGTSGVVLSDYGKVVCFVTHTSIGEQIAEALKRKKQKELSRSLMEVLSIVAYQQPITKGEVEEIREGKNCDYAFGALLDANLIEVVGRKDTLGRPMLYGTTQAFLEKFELKSLKKLPSRAEIEDRIAVLRREADEGGMLFREGVAMDETPVEAPVVLDDEEIESLVGAGENGDYDDTDYDAVAADDTTDDEEDIDETDGADTADDADTFDEDNDSADVIDETDSDDVGDTADDGDADDIGDDPADD